MTPRAAFGLGYLLLSLVGKRLPAAQQAQGQLLLGKFHNTWQAGCLWLPPNMAKLLCEGDLGREAWSHQGRPCLH